MNSWKPLTNKEKRDVNKYSKTSNKLSPFQLKLKSTQLSRQKWEKMYNVDRMKTHRKWMEKNHLKKILFSHRPPSPISTRPKKCNHSRHRSMSSSNFSHRMYDDDMGSILEKIIKINKQCEEEIQQRHEEEKRQEEAERQEFYQKDYDEIIQIDIESLIDLMYLGELYDPEDNKKYNINLKILNDMLQPLQDLQNMVGMKKLKDEVVDQILYYLQDFELENNNMLHTVIEGPPGCGKTEVSKILSRIYLGMGVVKSDYFKAVKRSDLIGKYLGSTAIKTQEVIDEVKEKGGVLFIDEAYSLGNEQKRDHFSKECIDTLNQNLTEEKSNFICIIAGYKDELQKSFFSYNQGLERRFPFRFTIEPYEAKELRQIFFRLVEKDSAKWSIKSEKDVPLKFFEKNKQYFKFNGGDMETLFDFTKKSHARRVFCRPKNEKKIIIKSDLDRGMAKFLENDSVKNRANNVSMQHLYI